MNTLYNVSSTETDIPCAKNSETGVSVDYIPTETKEWYVFRASYGREDIAYNIIVEDGTYCYIAKRYNKNRQEKKIQNLLPNIIFVYTTREKAEEYIKHTDSLSFLTYYYNHFTEVDGKNPPLVVPRKEMENFIRATASMNEHIMFVNPEQCHYRSGDIVRVTQGIFKGVEGRVARVAGQTRVVIEVSGIGLISTAYVPMGCMEVVTV